MSVQHIQRKVQQQALRIRPPAEPLQFWLNLIQDVPPEQELPDWHIPEPSSGGDPWAELLRAWDDVIAVLPPYAQRYVRLNRDRLLQRDLDASFERYELIRGALNVLREIARNKDTTGIRLNDSAGLITLRVNEKGEIEFELSPVFEALQGVEAARIRECQKRNCRRIFWAGRLDQPCCSTKCANARRVQNWRDRYQNVYKQNRLAKEQQPPKMAISRKSHVGASGKNELSKKGR